MTFWDQPTPALADCELLGQGKALAQEKEIHADTLVLCDRHQFAACSCVRHARLSRAKLFQDFMHGPSVDGISWINDNVNVLRARSSVQQASSETAVVANWF
jgi:hypothetical protein